MSEQEKDSDHGGEHGKPTPQIFKVQIDKGVYETKDPTPTARDLLLLAGKQPPEQYALYQKGRGGQPERVPLDTKVDLRDPGIEKFLTLPLDQTEGLDERRQFGLPQEDVEWLDARGLSYELVAEGPVLRVIIYDWPVHPGYNLSKVAANVRIEPGYPDTQIDMVYFYPGLTRLDGRAVGALAEDTFDGKVWQRWSRHRTPANPWRPGVDSLATHFGLVDEWLIREFSKG